LHVPPSWLRSHLSNTPRSAAQEAAAEQLRKFDTVVAWTALNVFAPNDVSGELECRRGVHKMPLYQVPCRVFLFPRCIFLIVYLTFVSGSGLSEC
jgi:hypothetical protein